MPRSTLLVVCHPRPESLTHAVADDFARGADGLRFERADLYGEDFDPCVRSEDEPDWDDPAKIYSAAVRAEMARISRNVATVMVFPVWWWSVPAMLKGWIDRVWNHGWAYGGGAIYPHSRVWMIGVAGGTRASFTKRGYDEAMRVQLDVGTLDYCDISDHRLEILYAALEGPSDVADLRERACGLGREFAATFS